MTDMDSVPATPHQDYMDSNPDSPGSEDGSSEASTPPDPPSSSSDAVPSPPPGGSLPKRVPSLRTVSDPQHATSHVGISSSVASTLNSARRPTPSANNLP